MPDSVRSRSRRRSRRRSRGGVGRLKQTSPLRRRLRGGAGKDDDDHGSKRKREDADEKPEPALKPLLTPAGADTNSTPTYLLDKLCAWQGLSTKNLLSNFSGLLQKVMEQVKPTTAVETANDPVVLAAFFKETIKEERKLNFSPPHVRLKLELIADICNQLKAIRDRAPFLESLIPKNCPVRSILPVYVNQRQRFAVWPIAYPQVILPSVNYIKKLNKVESRMNARLTAYLLQKDNTRFRNAVVLNRGHGSLVVTRNACSVFTIPEGKSVTIISVTNPGNVNYSSERELLSVVDVLTDATKNTLQDHFFRRDHETMTEFAERHANDVNEIRELLERGRQDAAALRPVNLQQEVIRQKWSALSRPLTVRSYKAGDVSANRTIKCTVAEPNSRVWLYEENLPRFYYSSYRCKTSSLLSPPTGTYREFHTDLFTVLTNVWDRDIDHVTYIDFSCLIFREDIETRRELLAVEEALNIAGLAGGNNPDKSSFES
jgi:hypothetical protein